MWRWGRGRLYIYRYTVTTRMTHALRWAAMKAILMFQSLRGTKSQDSVHRPQLLKRKESRSGFESRSLCLTARPNWLTCPYLSGRFLECGRSATASYGPAATKRTPCRPSSPWRTARSSSPARSGTSSARPAAPSTGAACTWRAWPTPPRWQGRSTLKKRRRSCCAWCWISRTRTWWRGEWTR